jgi:hypothetical protein
MYPDGSSVFSFKTSKESFEARRCNGKGGSPRNDDDDDDDDVEEEEETGNGIRALPPTRGGNMFASDMRPATASVSSSTASSSSSGASSRGEGGART